jgi:hypothetical protein
MRTVARLASGPRGFFCEKLPPRASNLATFAHNAKSLFNEVCTFSLLLDTKMGTEK